jgi:serine/threonine-protein kinase
MSEPITGRVIGDKYRITGLLRAGRMGDIYVGRSLDTNERVQLKLLDPELFGEKEAVRRFERETRITLKIDHPCTLVVRDYGRTKNGLPWMCTEYVEGAALSDVIEEQERLSPERAGYVAAQIGMALNAAHSIGVVHRDLSPINILLTDAEGHADSVKVLDFGLSRLTDPTEEDGSQLTAVGVRIGTPYYMAPEYIEEYALDHRADLYSLGIVLYEMLVGEPPFTGRPYKVMDMHLNKEPPAPSLANTEVPGWLDDLVAQLLVKDPEKRIQTATEAVERLEAGLQQRLQTVSAPSPVTPVQPLEERSHSPGATASDPLVQTFIESAIVDVTHGSGALNPQDSLLVARVAPGSLAASLKVEPGWLCQLPDEPAAGLRDPRLFRTLVRERRYILASPDGKQRVELKTTGANIGVEFIRTAEHIRAFYNPIKGSKDALLELWRQSDWESLETLSWRTISKHRGGASLLTTRLFSRFLGGTAKRGGDAIKLREHPALMFYGAALIEQGKSSEGLPLVEEYRNRYAHDFPSAFDAVAHYYIALEQEKQHRADLAVDSMLQSWLLWNHERSADGVERLAGRRPDGRAWYGKSFPDYTLDLVGSRGETMGLYQALERMADHQLMLVVIMGNDRSNEGYDQLMHRYHAYGYFFRDFIAGMHVITVETGTPADTRWLKGEDAVRTAEHPFELLEDFRGFLLRAVKPMSTPMVYAVSKRGYVLHEGLLDGVDLWTMLDLNGRLRTGQLR